MPDASTNRARALRHRLTQSEVALWHRLRDRRLGGHKFLRQVPIGPYVADFVCREARLIVEVDGSGHASRGSDTVRDDALVGLGFRILRFWNPEVLLQIDDVCETIVAAIDGRLEAYERFKMSTAREPDHPSSGLRPPSPRKRGEGDNDSFFDV